MFSRTYAPTSEAIIKKIDNNMKCEFSGKTDTVDDYSIMNKKINCPKCGIMVKITIPNKKMHSNMAKFASHAIEEKVERE